MWLEMWWNGAFDLRFKLSFSLELVIELHAWCFIYVLLSE